MTEQTVNIPLLRKAVEWVEAEAAKPLRKRRWFQGDWVAPARSLKYRNNDCGTCYCVAGYVASLEHSDDDLLARDLDDEESPEHPSQIAVAALGIDRRDAEVLFAPQNLAKDVRRIAESIAGERL